MNEQQQKLEKAFIEYAKADIEGALQLITGMFVGVHIAFCECMGEKGDSDNQINIKGPIGQRKITIHAKDKD